MSFIARWGTSCGTPFDAKEFCKQNIQWRDQELYLKDRPYQPWTTFSITHYDKLSKNKTKVKVEKIMSLKKTRRFKQV